MPHARPRSGDRLVAIPCQLAAFYANQHTGDLLARITLDVDQVQDVVVRGTDSVLARVASPRLLCKTLIALQNLLEWRRGGT